MLHLFGGDTVARRQAPTWRFPWKLVLTALAIVLVAVIAASAIFSVATNFSSSAPQPIIAQQPVAQPEVVVPVVPAMVDAPNPPVQAVSVPEVRLNWTYLGSAAIGTKGNVVQFPTLDRFFFISGPEILRNLKLPPDGVVYRPHKDYGGEDLFLGGGLGDGTAFFIQGHDGMGNDKYWFTPDRGEHWFKPANLDPGKTSTPARDTIALIEGDTLMLYMSLQPEPNVDSYWRAEIPLATLEELSP